MIAIALEEYASFFSLSMCFGKLSMHCRKMILNSKQVTWNGSHLGPCHNRLFFESHYGLDCLKILSGNNFWLKRVPTFTSMAAPQEMVTKTEVDACSNDLGF